MPHSIHNKFTIVKILVLLIFFSQINTGCAVVAGYAAYKVVRKATSRASKLSEEERHKIEFRNISGNKENILAAAKNTFKNYDYKIVEFDLDKGAFSAESENPPLTADVVIVEEKENSVGLRITLKDEQGVVENQRLYEHIFDNIENQIVKNGEN